MGGHALDIVSPERLDRDKYLEIEREVIEKIKDIIPNYYIPRYFDDKETFGDLDISYYLDVERDIKDEIVAALGSREYKINGTTLHCEYKSFQVDFILTEKEVAECNKCFLDFSSFGEILGRMFKCHELRYKHSGLHLHVCENSDQSKFITDIHLTNVPREMFEFLGLDYDRFVIGFKDNKNEMFDYLTTCSYFSTELFLEESNTIFRKKMTTRPVYKEFTDFITDKTYEKNPIIEFYKNNKTEFVRRTLEHFDKIDIYDKAVRKHNNIKIIKSKFNGKVIGGITHLENKELGNFINDFKDSFGDITLFDDFILDHTQDEINEKIVLFHKN